MNKEEAIEKLNALAWVQGGPYREEMIEAISMAIKALSAEQKEEDLAKDIARRMATIIENEEDMRVILKNASAEPTDLISRAEVHKTLSLLATEGGTDAKMLLSDAHEFIDELPSADRPSGEWEIYYPFMLSVEDQKSYRIKDPKEPIPDKRFGRIRCSVCKEDKHRGNNFCSNCGAKMGSDTR